jgi:hypothetical protein
MTAPRPPVAPETPASARGEQMPESSFSLTDPAASPGIGENVRVTPAYGTPSDFGTAHVPRGAAATVAEARADAEYRMNHHVQAIKMPPSADSSVPASATETTEFGPIEFPGL